jgi:hypothetical protein
MFNYNIPFSFVGSYVWILNFNYSVLALELREDRAQYEAKARELTRKFASLDRGELKRVSVHK